MTDTEKRIGEILTDKFGSEWRYVPGYEGRYCVSRDGRVATVWQGGGFVKSARIKKIVTNGFGYNQIALQLDRKRKNWMVHRLVLMAFVGPRPDGHECDHLDNNPTNNHVDNLRWVTKQANLAARIERGTIARGSRQGAARLTEIQVQAIWNLYHKGATRRELADVTKVHISTISRILDGEQWRHLARAALSEGDEK